MPPGVDVGIVVAALVDGDPDGRWAKPMFAAGLLELCGALPRTTAWGTSPVLRRWTLRRSRLICG